MAYVYPQNVAENADCVGEKDFPKKQQPNFCRLVKNVSRSSQKQRNQTN